MKFKIKRTRDKEACTYKTLYIKKEVSEQIEKIATEYNTSFNNIVISMIEAPSLWILMGYRLVQPATAPTGPPLSTQI